VSCFTGGFHKSQKNGLDLIGKASGSLLVQPWSDSVRSISHP
jgi:hypothetical protein